MSKITIVDGNNEIELSTAPKENIKAYMVKGESGADGISPTASVTKVDDTATITITDKNGTTEADVVDGFNPTIESSRSGNVTTFTITDINGTETVDIADGIDLTGGVPTNGVIGYDLTEIIYTCDGTESGNYYLTYDNIDYYFTMPTVEDGDTLIFNVDDLELSLDGTVITTASTGTGTELTFIDNIPNGYEKTDESLGGADIPQQATAPVNPKKNDLWIDTDDDSSLIGVKGTTTVSDSDTYSCNYLNQHLYDMYSTNEVLTNKIWKDGKPIYRTVIDKGDIAIPSGYGNLFNHGIQNIDQVTDCIGCIYNPSTGYMSRGTYVDGDGYKIFTADNTVVQYLGTTYMSSGYGTQKSFIIEYTKTTDSGDR